MKPLFFLLLTTVWLFLAETQVYSQSKVYRKAAKFSLKFAKPDAFAIAKGLTLVSLPKQKPMIYEQMPNGRWQFREALTSKDFHQNHSFGFSLALNKIKNDLIGNGNRAIVGAPMKATDANGKNRQKEAGAAYIFEQQEDGSWQQMEELVAPNRRAFDHFGWSVSIQGDYVIVGIKSMSKGDDREVCIFKRTQAGKWLYTQSLKIPADTKGSTEGFGQKVVLSGTYALVSSGVNDLTDQNEINESTPGVFVYQFSNGVYKFAQEQDYANPTSTFTSSETNNNLLMGTQSVLLLLLMGVGTMLFKGRRIRHTKQIESPSNQEVEPKKNTFDEGLLIEGCNTPSNIANLAIENTTRDSNVCQQKNYIRGIIISPSRDHVYNHKSHVKSTNESRQFSYSY